MSGDARPIAYLTAGAGGMICGSCLHDNTLARALQRRGIDVQLIPTYTPIRTDEPDVSTGPVFYGGLNVYLSQVVPFYRRLPEFAVQWLNHPSLIRWATQRTTATSAASLGALTVSMLRGMGGNQRREVKQLGRALKELNPRLIVLSNGLIAGCVPHLKSLLDVPILVTLQGDDIFLESLPEPHRQRAIRLLHQLVPSIDGFLVNSDYYARRMGTLLDIPPDKFVKVPLGVDVADFPPPGQAPPDRPAGDAGLVLGYLARLTPEKGFHQIVDAFLELKRRQSVPGLRLQVAGWRGPQHAAFIQEQIEKIQRAGCAGDFEDRGSLDRRGKVEFLRELDLFSVPSPYEEPKGLYVLEALAAGVPVVQPAHGAFPELLAESGGGLLVAPDSIGALADGLESLLTDAHRRQMLGREGQQRVHRAFHSEAMAESVWQVWQRFLFDPLRERETAPTSS